MTEECLNELTIDGDIFHNLLIFYSYLLVPKNSDITKISLGL